MSIYGGMRYDWTAFVLIYIAIVVTLLLFGVHAGR